jgi:hypothetical protein
MTGCYEEEVSLFAETHKFCVRGERVADGHGSVSLDESQREREA